MLPREAYVADEVLAWERRHLFAGQWVCLGRVEDAVPLKQRALVVGDVAVLVTRDGDRVRGFANFCRHRGHELLTVDKGNDWPAIVCPYHGWSYELSGRVKAAPRMEEGFEAGKYPLVELPVEVWHGWVFVNALKGALPFQEYVAGLEEIVAPYQAERLVRKATHAYEVAANWKTIVENYHECYHCPLIHPELCKVSPPNSGDNWDSKGAWVGGRMELRPGAETMSLDGRSRGIPLQGVDPRTVSYVGVFPNLLISLHPDYVMTHRLTPVKPNVTKIECSWYFHPDTPDPTYAVEFWDITNREDWAACESVQRGAESPHFVPGPLAPAEDAVHQWVTMVARGYCARNLAKP